jgi:hypothetical protein
VEAQRISLADAGQRAEQPIVSPDTNGARWIVAGSGQAVELAKAGQQPYLTLTCQPGLQPMVRIVRHVAGRVGEQALFPVLGNGKSSRFKLDVIRGGEDWQWQGQVPAADPQLDVFSGSAELEATLPGGGTLLIAGSSLPGGFVAWCRAGGIGQLPALSNQSPLSTAPLKSISSRLPG